jgi:hypothetical protein
MHLLSLAAAATTHPLPPADDNVKGSGSETTIALAIGVLPPIIIDRKVDVFALQLPYHSIK